MTNLAIFIGILVFGVFAVASSLFFRPNKRVFLDHFGDEVDIDKTVKEISKREGTSLEKLTIQRLLLKFGRANESWILGIGKIVGIDLDRMKKLILEANYNWFAEDVIILQVMTLFIGLSLSVISIVLNIPIVLSIFILFFTFMLWYYPLSKLKSIAKKRKLAFQEGLPDFLGAIEIPLSNGLPILRVIERVSQSTQGIVGEEFRRVILESKVQGERIDKPLEDLYERIPLPDLSDFISSLANARATGIDLGQIVSRMANELRIKQSQANKEKANKIPTKNIIVLVIFFVLPYLIIMMAPVLYSMGQSFSGSGL